MSFVILCLAPTRAFVVRQRHGSDIGPGSSLDAIDPAERRVVPMLGVRQHEARAVDQQHTHILVAACADTE